MSGRDKTWVLKPSRKLRDMASALVDQANVELNPKANPHDLIRIAAVESALDALKHLDPAVDDISACSAIGEAVVMLARIFADGGDFPAENYVNAIHVAAQQALRDDLGEIARHSGPRKEAS